MSYTLKHYLKELKQDCGRENNEAGLYAVKMNPFVQENGQYIIATAGRNKISIFECEESGRLVLKQTYCDSDRNENFFCCCWAYLCENESVAGNPAIIAGGSKGVIRIIDIINAVCVKNYKGHGASINDVKLHPKDANLFLSASKDHSIRLWNILTDTCIAIFGGVEGHRDEVLSADFHLTGTRIVSCGMDHALKIWKLDKDKIRKSISLSYKCKLSKPKQPFETIKDQFPMFTTRNVHRNYVDCVAWYGNFILSKSCENSIVLWKVGKLETGSETDLSSLDYSTDQTITVLTKFECENNEIWFIRFATDYSQNILACGNQIGCIYVWEIDEDDPNKSRCIKLTTSKCVTPIRQICFSENGRIMVAVSDDSSIWRWDRDGNLEEKNSDSTE